MMNSAPAVVGASDGLAAFRSIIAKRGPALAWARGATLRYSSWSLTCNYSSNNRRQCSTRFRHERFRLTRDRNFSYSLLRLYHANALARTDPKLPSAAKRPARPRGARRRAKNKKKAHHN